LWPARQSVTDEQGTTRISGLLKGAYDLQASLGTEVSPPLVGLNLERGQDGQATLVLEPGRMVTAIVNDGDGDSPALVPNADVVLSSGGLGSFPLLGRTGTNGRVTLGPIPPGPASLAARAEGFVSSALVPVPEDTTEPVEVSLLRGATLKGTVVDGRDFPVEGASIEIIGTDSFGLPVSETPFLNAFRRTHFDFSLAGPLPLIPAGELGVMPGPVPPIPAAGTRIEPGADLWALASAPPPVVPDWVTRSDGRFTANPVTPGRVRAVARHPDYVEGVSELVALRPGGEAHVKIVMLAGGQLAGRVRDDRGYPVDGAELEIASTRTSLVRVLVTKGDGSFELSGVPSEVIVSVRRSASERRIVLRKTIEVAEGKRTELELELPAVREPVRVVVESEGNPVELAEVTVLSIDPDVPLRETLFTDSEGAVEITDARGLSLRIVAEAPGAPRRAVVVDEAPAEVTIKLEAGVIVEGTVAAGSRGWVEGARVSLISDGARRVTLTDAEGKFRVADVAPGVAHLSVLHPDYANVELDVTIERTARADRPHVLDTIELVEPGTVEGEVVDQEDEPVAGARVATGIVPAFLPTGTLPPGVTQTDANGRFVLGGIAPGKHTLEASSPVAGRGRVHGIEVRGGRVTDRVRIVLTAPASDDGSLLGGNVAVTLGERGGEVVVVAVAPSSEAERGGLVPGDVIVTIDGAAAGGMTSARKRLAGRPGTDVVIEIRRDAHSVVLRIQRELVRK
jgi:protocatechuate 3,4-dioxygenase beta subunit